MNTIHWGSKQGHVLHHNLEDMVEGNVLDHHFQDHITLARTTSGPRLYLNAETSNQPLAYSLEVGLKK